MQYVGDCIPVYNQMMYEIIIGYLAIPWLIFAQIYLLSVQLIMHV